MRTIYIPKNICGYQELSETAKYMARLKLVDTHDWYSESYEDFVEVGKVLGIEIENIYHSGFSYQGDGACFEGSYAYRKGAHKEIRQYAPLDEDLHSIADRLLELQKKAFYGLSCTVRHSGSYNHDGCTEFTWSTDANRWWLSDFEDALAEEMKEVLRSFMKWMYRKLEEDYQYQTSDEAMIELCTEHDFEFFEDGEPVN